MSRIQLALNVDDLDAAVDHYSALFATAPHKRRPGYVNFEIADPPMKLVLFHNPGSADRLNHLGVEATDHTELAGIADRWAAAGLAEAPESETCCYAEMDKTWATGLAGHEWEAYVITDDEPDATVAAPEPATLATPGGCVCS